MTTNIFNSNNTKNININHAQYILNWIASNGSLDKSTKYSVNNQNYTILSSDLTNIDFNKDGKIDIIDAQYILNWLAAGGNQNNLSVIYSINNQAYHMFHIFKLNYSDSILDQDIVFVNNYFNSILKQSNINQLYIIDISLENLSNNTLGYATSNKIVLNTNNTNLQNMFLNDQSISPNSVVLIHEILHILGIGLGPVWNSLINTNNFTYMGNHGINQYKELLSNNQYNSNLIQFIPIENNFGSGTILSHLEEGLDNDFVIQKRYIDSVYYPVISNEISTGFLSTHSFFTSITLGILNDLGFTVNYQSNHILNSSPNMNFI